MKRGEKMEITACKQERTWEPKEQKGSSTSNFLQNYLYKFKNLYQHSKQCFYFGYRNTSMLV